MSRPDRISLGILATIGVGAAVWAALAVWVVPGLIETGWRAESAGFINDLFAGRDEHPPEKYLATWRSLWPGLLANGLGLGALLALLLRPEVRRTARRVFGTSASEVFDSAPKLLICVVLLSLWVGEWFPFSPFPMYSAFVPEGGYVHLTDAADEPVAAREHVKMDLDIVRGVFRSFMKDERERRGIDGPGWWVGLAAPKDAVAETAARRTLLYLRDERSASRTALKLWRTRITLREGRIHTRRELLAEVPDA